MPDRRLRVSCSPPSRPGTLTKTRARAHRSAFHGEFLLVPVEHTTREVGHLLEAEGGEHRRGGGAANSRAADGDDLFVFVRGELLGSRGELAKGDQNAASDVPQLTAVLVGF